MAKIEVNPLNEFCTSLFSHLDIWILVKKVRRCYLLKKKIEDQKVEVSSVHVGPVVENLMDLPVLGEQKKIVERMVNDETGPKVDTKGEGEQNEIFYYFLNLNR